MSKVRYNHKNFAPEINYHGKLNHDGSIRVAKGNVKAKIINIAENNVLVKGHKPNSYVCAIHQALLEHMYLVTVGDTAFIRFKNGKPYLVGFLPATADNSIGEPTGDAPVHQNGKMDWLTFFDKMEMEK